MPTQKGTLFRTKLRGTTIMDPTNRLQPTWDGGYLHYSDADQSDLCSHLFCVALTLCSLCFLCFVLTWSRNESGILWVSSSVQWWTYHSTFGHVHTMNNASKFSIWRPDLSIQYNFIFVGKLWLWYLYVIRSQHISLNSTLPHLGLCCIIDLNQNVVSQKHCSYWFMEEK